MKYIFNFLLQLPIVMRVIVFLFIPLMICILCRKLIIRALSIVPFMMQRLFRVFYLLVEVPVDLMHRKFGASFYNLDNGISHIGKQIDIKLEQWFSAWYFSEGIQIGKIIVCYVASVVLVVFPSLCKIEEGILTVGEKAFLHCENEIVSWLDERGWYEDTTTAVSAVEVIEMMKEERSFQEDLIVFGVKSSLLVRDMPAVKGTTLAKLYNDDVVLWKGQMMFGEADNQRIEAWVKITTKDGIEGWCRLHYVRPQQYQEREYLVTELEMGIE